MKLASDASWPLLSPATQVAVLRDALQNWKPGPEPLELPSGIYDMGDKEVLIGMKSSVGNPVTIKATPGQTILRCSQTLRLPTADGGKDGSGKLLLNPDGTAVDRGALSVFIHGQEVVFDGLQLESTCPLNRQSTLVGPGWDWDGRWDQPGPRKATFRNCKLYGRTFGTYLWHMDGDSHVFEDDNYVVAGNIAVCMGRSSGFGAQIVRVVGDRNKFVTDPTRSTQHGDTTNSVDGGQVCILVRGGQLYIDKPLMLSGKGNDDEIGGPQLAGISDHMTPGSSVHSLIKINAPLMVKLTPGKSTKILADVEIQNIGSAPSATGRVLIGGTGSAPDGGLLIRKLVK